MQTGGKYDGGDDLTKTVGDTFGRWQELAALNKTNVKNGELFTGFLIQFEDARTAMHRYG